MLQDIDKHIKIINDSLAWAKEFGKDSFPTEQFKDYRRKLSKIRNALSGKCSAAAYGESQVGKSYLMSSLLSSADNPFVIENNDKEYSFIYELNPSGGNNSLIESTGVITRFTVNEHNNTLPGKVKVSNLSVVDIILLLIDSYYNDLRINADTGLTTEAINQEIENLTPLWAGQHIQHNVICEDDIRDISDYIKDIIGNNAMSVFRSNFCKTIAPVIQYIPYDKWVDVFSLLWNKNTQLDRLFATLISAYKKLNFQQEVYVPFEAVLHKNGTLLKISWLDTVCGVAVETGTDIPYTDVYGSDGNLLASNFSKGELSALIAELTFVLPKSVAEDRKFLRYMDLLDFPGARSREKYKEQEIGSMLPKILRRGKVAYLFNKYSRSLQISSVLFCHHDSQKAQPTIGETINDWIEDNIGKTAKERTQMLRFTNGIAPLFFVATKFNKDLERTRTDIASEVETLDKHWNRFDTVFPEIIKPNTWFEQWVEESNGAAIPFRSIYPLRDFYWSAKNGLFDGYSDGDRKSPEISVHHHSDYPEYMSRLKASFLRNTFVKQHFTNPEKVWDEVATLNNDGSKAIIRDLDAIAPLLDKARRERYFAQLEALKKDVIKSLEVFYEPEDTEAKNKKVRLIAGDIRRSLSGAVAKNPAIFGRILDKMMVSPEALRHIAYDIIVRHADTPKDMGPVQFIRAEARINTSEPRPDSVQKLLDYYFLDTEEELIQHLNSIGFELDDVISKEVRTLSTMGDVIAKHIVDYWIEHLNAVAQSLEINLPHAVEVVFMLTNLFKKLGVRTEIASKINRYIEIFPVSEQPNAIGDYAALTLNNFVSTVGRKHLSDDKIGELARKAQTVRLNIDFSPKSWETGCRPQPLQETLAILDKSASIVNQQMIDLDILRRLPFWNSYRRWENLVLIGLLYSSDISHCDPACNEKVRNLIDRTQHLYS